MVADGTAGPSGKAFRFRPAGGMVKALQDWLMLEGGNRRVIATDIDDAEDF